MRKRIAKTEAALLLLAHGELVASASREMRSDPNLFPCPICKVECETTVENYIRIRTCKGHGEMKRANVLSDAYMTAVYPGLKLENGAWVRRRATPGMRDRPSGYVPSPSRRRNLYFWNRSSRWFHITKPKANFETFQQWLRR